MLGLPVFAAGWAINCFLLGRSAKPAPGRLRSHAGAQCGVLFFSPCLFGPVGDPAERADFLAAAFSDTAPLERPLLLVAWVLPPLESLVDWGICSPCPRRESAGKENIRAGGKTAVWAGCDEHRRTTTS